MGCCCFAQTALALVLTSLLRHACWVRAEHLVAIEGWLATLFPLSLH